jgi:DNA invertase Pin-like site-specific DNA recombinase
MKKSNNTLHIYTRVSTSNQIKGHSLDAQKKRGIDKAKSLGFEYTVLSEAGKSAGNEDVNNRPEFIRLIDMCVNGKIKHIFVTEWDRLSRDELLTALLKKTLKENGVTIYTVRETLDLNDSNSNFIDSIRSAFVECEKKVRGDRIKRGKIEAAKRRAALNGN